MKWIDWTGCYDGNWQGLITGASFAHPAKAARGLLRRIFDYLFRHGYLHKGDLVLDPFGGIGSTGIESASRGCRFIGCELEPKFHALALDNFALHRRTWELSGDPLPVMVCGDSRRLCEVVGPALADACVSSPPFHPQMNQGGDTPAARGIGRNTREQRPCEADGKHNLTRGYGTTPGQLGGMPTGEVDAVISSPPYIETNVGNDDAEAELRRIQEKAAAGVPMGREHRRIASKGELCPHMQAGSEGYGDTPGQLGALKLGDVADAVVSSPPYEGSSGNPMMSGSEIAATYGQGGIGNRSPHGPNTHRYGETNGQLGHSTGETFWSAARLILEQTHALCRPGAMTVWIVKDFVRKKARVDFCGDWCRLLEATGFRVVVRARAWLVKETARYQHLHTDEEVVEKTERKSFFRRLAEKKGSPRIDWEEVIFAVRQ